MPLRLIMVLLLVGLAISVGEAGARELDDLVVRVDLDVDDPALTAGNLNVSGQKFEGAVERGRIRGVFTIGRGTYHGRDAPLVFRPARESLRPHLASTPDCDADHESIGKQAAGVTSVLSRLDRWSYATALCFWVRRNISEKDVRPRASSVLAAKAGDHEGRALLLAALCRACGIPARVVKGAILEAPTLRARDWVEVHMGKAGWVPLDPSDRSLLIDASHVRLGAWMIGVREVEVQKALPRPARPVPFTDGKPHRYDILTDAGRLGRITFAVEPTKLGYRMSLATKFEHFVRTSVLETDLHARPIRFLCETDGKSGTTKETVSFRDGVARVERLPAGRERRERRVETGRDVFLFANEAFPLWALLVTQLDFSEGRAVKINVFHPTWKETAHATLRPGEWSEIDWEGEKIRALPVTVLLGCKQMLFWLDEKSRLLRCDEESRTTVLSR